MVAKVLGYTRNRGIAIMMEHSIPGAGGHHRKTLSYRQPPDLSHLPWQERLDIQRSISFAEIKQDSDQSLKIS
jgi:hypothetical protein